MKRLFTSAVLFLCCVATSFAQFSGSGSGTENDPYLILNPIHLNQMRNFLNQEGVYFKIMADIDLTEFIADENPSQGWQPVGTSSAPFSGILDGNYHEIKGLWANRPNTDYVGLFGYTSNATIKNITLSYVNITGNYYVGGICGHGSNIINTNVSGIVNGNTFVGGFCGSNGGFENCKSKVDVIATGHYVGGLSGSGGGNVKNCYVECKAIQGKDYVGGLCGAHSVKSKIEYSCVSANIEGNDYIGGIVGYTAYYEKEWHGTSPKGNPMFWYFFATTVDNNSFIGNIIGNSYIGGIVGAYSVGGGNSNSYSDHNIRNCFSCCDIRAKNNYVGGIAGYVETTTNILNCYSMGSIVGNENVGGIVGHCSNSKASIMHSYSNTTISGYNYVGGLVGYNSSGNIKSCVAMNHRISTNNSSCGRVFGYNKYGIIGQIGSGEDNKAYNQTIVICQGVAQAISDDEQNGTGVSSTTLKLKATYVAMGWDFTDIWEILETECYPYFKCQTAPPVITSKVVSGATTISGKCVNGGRIKLEIDGIVQETTSSGNSFSFNVSPLQAGQEVRVSAKADGKEQSYYATEIVASLGSGKENDPYQVFTAADLTSAYRKGYYKLMNDIDLTDYIDQNSPSEGWQSIGRDGCETIHFDGDGHKITGLWCNTTRDNTGLFSCFANGTIKNLMVETAKGKQVKGGANTGILIGKMINGTIENCRVSGTVADGTPVGGMVGQFDGGKISLSQANVTINTTSEKSYVGGLVGEITSGEIDQCVTLGNITATGKESYVGGLIGKNSATVTNCYSNINVTSSYNAAGLIAYNLGIVDKCYATGNLASSNYGAGVIGYNDGANAVIKNSAAMNNKIDVTYESQSAQSGGYGQRIIGGIKNGAPAPEMNNYALKYMQVSVNGIAQKVYDDIMNGVGKNGSDLVKGSTYQELGWNFSTIWNINEGNTYPSLKKNAAEVLKPGEDPIEVKVTAPTAKNGLVYTGNAQELVSAGGTNVGTLKYSLDGSSYSSAIPTGTDAKTYTIHYKAVDDGNKDLTTAASLTVTISPRTVSSPAITLSETSFVYDGQEKKPTVTVKDGNTIIPTSEYTVSYSNNINIGNATVTIKDKEGGNYIVNGSTQFAITAASANVTVPQVKSGLVYNGNAQELITAGSSSDGTLQYSLDGSNYSTTIPKGTDAKTYTVYYKVKGDANHGDTEPATLTVTISPKTVSSPTIILSQTSYEYDGNEKKPTVTVKDGNTIIPTSEYTISYSNNVNIGNAIVTIKDKEGGNYIVNGSAQFTITAATANVTAPKAKSGLVYTGSAQELITAGSSSNGQIQYSLDGSNYSTAIPTGTDAKAYTVYYRVKGDANHSNTEPATLTATISPKTVSSPTITLSQASYEYDGNEKKPTVTVKDENTTIPASEYSVSYSNNVNVGTAIVAITDKDGGNYVVNGSAYFTITTASANVTAPKTISGLVYNGRAQELIIAGSSSNGQIQYSLDGSNYSTAIPNGTDAKTYTVYYRVKGDANHSNTEPVVLTVTISPAPLTIKAGSYTKKQGENNPVFTLTYEGFVNYETEEVLTKRPTVTCLATKDSPAGEYEIVVGGAQSQNYDITYVNGKLTIEKADEVQAVYVTAKSYTREYGDENPIFEYYSLGATLDGTPEITCEATATSPVGTYPIVIKKGSVTNTNDWYENGTLTITPAPLTISAGDYTMTEGNQLPEFELQYDGFKNNETETVLTTKPTVKCEATSESTPGRYEIIVSGAKAPNYDILYQFGWLTVEIAQGIQGVIMGGLPFDVYNAQGRKVRSNATSLKGLPKGVYIINSKKVIL